MDGIAEIADMVEVETAKLVDAQITRGGDASDVFIIGAVALVTYAAKLAQMVKAEIVVADVFRSTKVDIT
jgi:hypothetical protein